MAKKGTKGGLNFLDLLNLSVEGKEIVISS
jgi:hypothetical protein